MLRKPGGVRGWAGASCLTYSLAHGEGSVPSGHTDNVEVRVNV